MVEEDRIDIFLLMAYNKNKKPIKFQRDYVIDLIIKVINGTMRKQYQKKKKKKNYSKSSRRRNE